MARAQPTISTFSVTKGGKVAETYALFAAWDLAASLDENLNRFRRENPILAATDAWLNEIRRIFHARFSDIDRHRTLIRLAQGPRALPLETWRPLLLWHLCFRELLVSDFLETWLYPRKQDGQLRVRNEDVRSYLLGLRPRGLLEIDWKPSSLSRMASGLPAYVAAFGLLRGGQVKEIVPLHLPDEALLYILLDLAGAGERQEGALSDPRWRRVLISRDELEQELLRLHQRRVLRFEIAGSVVSLDLPHRSLEEYVERLVG